MIFRKYDHFMAIWSRNTFLSDYMSTYVYTRWGHIFDQQYVHDIFSSREIER